VVFPLNRPSLLFCWTPSRFPPASQCVLRLPLFSIYVSRALATVLFQHQRTRQRNRFVFALQAWALPASRLLGGSPSPFFLGAPFLFSPCCPLRPLGYICRYQMGASPPLLVDPPRFSAFFYSPPDPLSPTAFTVPPPWPWVSFLLAFCF